MGSVGILSLLASDPGKHRRASALWLWCREGQRLPPGQLFSTFRLLAVVGTLAGLLGCMPQPPQSGPPQTVLQLGSEVFYRSGPLLVPEQEVDVNSLRPEDAFAVEITSLPLERCCPDGLVPIEHKARLITVSPRGCPHTQPSGSPVYAASGKELYTLISDFSEVGASE